MSMEISLDTAATRGFSDMALIEPLLSALDKIGYETPSPIQAQTIPYLLQGRDVLGQAQTGTGKTAAFALPLLSRMDVDLYEPQILVLTPTRELAIQVAESFQTYASGMGGVRVLPVYGGQDYLVQLRALKRGVHIVVGTPGRVMDHIRRGTLKMETLKAVVLDEADEMLNMGFLEDVEWIMEQTPAERQVALFCATMPESVRRIAKKNLRNPKEIRLILRTNTVATLNQRYWLISGLNKLDTLSRILETETYDGMLIFMRTKTGTVELVEQLEKRGYAAEALNGDMKQSQREQTVNRFKSGKLNILIATDVAARGLDVERVSHVINYDIPFDTETYIHRVGRTGRAGRAGEAILFVAPRERHLLHAIESATKQKIALMALPGVDDINAIRINRFKQRITDAIEAGGTDFYTELVNDYSSENGVDPLAVAAALAKLVQGDRPFLLEKRPENERRVPAKYSRASRDEQRGMEREEQPRRRPRIKADPSMKMECFRMEVGREHGVKCGNIVGAIANEAKLDSVYIQKVKIHKDYSTVELPAGIPKHVLHILKKARVMNRPLEISRINPEFERGVMEDHEPPNKDVRKASRNADEYSKRTAEKKTDKKAAVTDAKKAKKKAGLKKKTSA